MFLPALPCLRRLKQAMVVVLPEGFRSLKRTLARLDPDEKLTISVIYPCFPWFSFDALGLFYESRLGYFGGPLGATPLCFGLRRRPWQRPGGPCRLSLCAVELVARTALLRVPEIELGPGAEA